MVDYAREEILTLRQRVKELEAELDRIKKLYDEWGFSDSPCPKHSKPAILAQNNCASCRAVKAEAELSTLRAERDALEERVNWFESSGGIAAHVKVFELRADNQRLKDALRLAEPNIDRAREIADKVLGGGA
jgi:BMFP domain-containing protein YqiC